MLSGSIGLLRCWTNPASSDRASILRARVGGDRYRHQAIAAAGRQGHRLPRQLIAVLIPASRCRRAARDRSRARSAASASPADAAGVTTAPARSSTSTNSSRASASSSTTSTRTPSSARGNGRGRRGRCRATAAAAGLLERQIRDRRQAHAERRARPSPSLSAVIDPAVQLDEIAHDREAEAEAAVAPRAAGVLLAEPLEDVRQEFGGDADAGVGRRRISTLAPARASARTPTCPPCGVNLTAFESRFQTICCSRSGSARIELRPGSIAMSSAIALASAAGVDRVGRLRGPRRPTSTGRTSSRSLPRDHARHVEQVVDEPRLRAGVALDGLRAPFAPRALVDAAVDRACAPSRRWRSAACAARATRSSGTDP